jgi:hypothetical protein
MKKQEQLKKTEQTTSSSTKKSEDFSHDQLLQALYWVHDLFDRANMPFFLVYNTAESVLQKKQLEGDSVQVGVRLLEWNSGAKTIIDTFAQPDMKESEEATYIYNGVPVVVHVYTDDRCITSPDTVIYNAEYFKLPNPYRRFMEVFGNG